MRRLIYVPIIHMSADLGTLSEEVRKKGIRGLGEEVWERHARTVSNFWDSLGAYFRSMDARGLRVYQDGMVAEGGAARKIIEEAAGRGSKNHEIVKELADRGATVIRTERLELLKKERDLLLGMTRAGRAGRFLSYIKYIFTKNELLKKRDRFIGERINETLREGETGVLFMGAFHDVLQYLPKDIEVVELKDREKVREYQEKFFLARKGEEVERLSEYLRGPVEKK